MIEHRRRYDNFMGSFKKWWHVIALIFGTGLAWGTMRNQVEDHERRISKLENIPSDLQEIKDLIRNRNRRQN